MYIESSKHSMNAKNKCSIVFKLYLICFAKLNKFERTKTIKDKKTIKIQL